MFEHHEATETDYDSLRKIGGIISRLIRPMKVDSLREWADKNRILPADAARPGQWSTDWAKPAPEIYDAWSNPLVSEIIVICGTQMLKSEFIINAILQTVEQNPGPILLLQPDVALAKEFAKERIGNSAQVMPYHQPYLAPENTQGQKGTGTIYARPFPGGVLHTKSTEQKSSLISTSYKFTFCDEINKFNKDVRGAVRSRQTVYTDSKLVMVSSAGEKDQCRITQEWERGDKRRWHLCCPQCETYFYPIWKHTHWQGNAAETATYECQSCKALLDSGDMHMANLSGKWIAEEEFNGIASFMVNSFAHPLLSMQDLVEEYIDARRYFQRNGDDERLKNFFCDRLSETYTNQSGVIEPSELEKLYIDYPMGDETMPQEVVLITAAVDVQKDRLEVDVRGWGSYQALDSETQELFTRPVRFGLHYFKLDGDPGRGDVYKALLKYFKDAQFTRPDGLKLKIARMGIDMGGAPGDSIQSFIRYCASEKLPIFPLKGTTKNTDPIFRLSLSKEQRERWLTELILVGAHTAKDTHFASLRRSITDKIERSEWYFPTNANRGYDKEYLAGLVAEEEKRIVDKYGAVKKRYVPQGKARNEPLDLANYNEALMRSVGIEGLPKRRKKFIRQMEIRKKGGGNAKGG